MRRTLAALGAMALLTACSGDAEPTTNPADPSPAEQATEPTPDVDPTEAGEPTETDPASTLPTWTTADEPNAWICSDIDRGVHYWIMVPLDESHEDIRRAEELRELAGVEEKPTYVYVEIDASEAAEASWLREMGWATTERESVNADVLDEVVYEWGDSHGEDYETGNQYIEFGNELKDKKPNRGAVGYQIMVTDGSAESMVAPMLTDTWYSSIDCYLEAPN